MKPISILLSIDGSAEARAAAHTAWQLAQQSESNITAQHVIDSQAAWKFLSHSSAGFIGSGPYLDAHEQINQALRSIADSLMLSYISQAEGRGVHGDSYIDEGDTVATICDRAKNHDLVVLGHRTTANQSTSICARLARLCPRPMLIVQNGLNQLSKICLLLNEQVTNESIREISEFGANLGLPTELYLHASFGKEHTLDWADQLATIVADLPTVAIKHCYDESARESDMLFALPQIGRKSTDYLLEVDPYLLWPSLETSEEFRQTKAS